VRLRAIPIALLGIALMRQVGPVAAAPTVSIRAHTEIRLRPIRKDYGDVYVLAGQLVDRYSGEGIGGEPVTVELAGQRIRTITAPDGSFEVRASAPGGRQHISVRFDGGGAVDQSRVDLKDVDIDKNPVDLSITTAAESGGVRIAVAARSAGADLQLPVSLRVGPAEVAADRLAEVATITAGGAPFVLTRAAAGGPGTRRVRAVFAGDGLHGPASADATVELTTATTTTLAVGSRSIAFEDDVVATGAVLDEDDRGVARAPVALLAGTRRVAQAVTGKDGSFRFRFEGRVLGQGDHSLQAVVEPTEGWMRTSRSSILRVEVAAPQPVPIAYTLAAFAITALVAAGFFAARSRPWQRLRRKARDDGERAPADVPAEPTAGLVLARPSLVSTLRRPTDHGFTGVIRDAIRHRPVPLAHVILRRGGTDDAREVTASADGSFGVEELAAGDWRAEIAQRGHVTERFTISIPHRGELRGARVDLMPVRERIFSLYKRAALPLLPDPARWGVWSPRQVFDHVRGRRPAAALADLTDFVEAAYFAADQPDEDRLGDAQARVDAALREQVV
jgi:hypothetical protein